MPAAAWSSTCWQRSCLAVRHSLAGAAASAAPSPACSCSSLPSISQTSLGCRSMRSSSSRVQSSSRPRLPTNCSGVLTDRVARGCSKRRMMMRRHVLVIAALGLVAGLAAVPAPAQDLDLSLEASHKQIEAWANEPIDTSKYKKDPPYKVGLSAGYLSNSWILFCSQLLRHEASLHPEISDVLVTDAAFNPAKQVADIEDLV